jgi:hypothetical protein
MENWLEMGAPASCMLAMQCLAKRNGYPKLLVKETSFTLNLKLGDIFSTEHLFPHDIAK